MTKDLCNQNNRIRDILVKYSILSQEALDELSSDSKCIDALYEEYVTSGTMPYGIAKARTGDPIEWIIEKVRPIVEVIEGEVINDTASVELNRVFAWLSRLEPELECAIIGSSIHDYTTAHDIDVLVRASYDIKTFFKRHRLTYLGGFDRDGIHVRRCRHFTIPGVSLPVQILQWNTVEVFESFPHRILFRDGTCVNTHITFSKPKTKK